MAFLRSSATRFSGVSGGTSHGSTAASSRGGRNGVLNGQSRCPAAGDRHSSPGSDRCSSSRWTVLSTATSPSRERRELQSPAQRGILMTAETTDTKQVEVGMLEVDLHGY